MCRTFFRQIGERRLFYEHEYSSRTAGRSACRHAGKRCGCCLLYTSSNEITDAKKNLRDSVICALDSGSRGVMVVFGGHVIAGTRAKKNKTISYDAFASVNFPALALVQGDRLVRYVPSPWPTGPVEFGRALSPRVFLLKLTPGLSPDLIPDIFRLYDCVIVELSLIHISPM